MSGSHISLFSGVGMTDLAVEASGFKTVAWAENDPFCQQVLRRRFPDAAEFSDVRHVSNAVQFRTDLPLDRPLLVSGGFPCQDVASPSSTQTGIQGARSGLWTEFARIIREFKPELVLIENSNMLRQRGLDRVLTDLYERGYDARWDCIPATAVGAPHRRDRIWIVAKPVWGLPLPKGRPLGCAFPDHGGVFSLGRPVTKFPRAGFMRQGMVRELAPLHTVKDSLINVSLGRTFPTITLSDGTGGPGTTPKREGGKNLRTVINELEGNGRINPLWGEWLMGLPIGWTDPSIPNDRLLAHPGWAVEPMGVPRTSTYRNSNRTARIKALGNGLVPQVAQMALFELSLNGGI